MSTTLSRRPILLIATFVILASAALWVQRVGRAYLMERRELEAVVPADDTTIARARLAQLRDVSWTLGGGELQHAWYVPSGNGALVVYLHGSPGSRASLLPEAMALAAHGYGALLLDLPGYGKSAGARHWDGAFDESVRRAFDFAASQPGVETRRIGGLGYSMGSAVLARVAAGDARVRSVALVAAFTRLEDQLRHQFRSRIPGAAAAAVFAARHAGVGVDELETEAALMRLGERRLLLVAGELDHAIPAWMPQRLARAARRAELYVAPGVGHAGFAERLRSIYTGRLIRFFDETLPRDPPAQP